METLSKRPAFDQMYVWDPGLISAAHEVSTSYIAWQVGRKHNPFFNGGGTGFEKFFVREQMPSPESVVQRFAKEGNRIARAIVSLHPHSVRYDQITQVLREEKISPLILEELNAWFGTMLAIFRAEVNTDWKNASYREGTHQAVGNQKITYSRDTDGKLRETYRLPTLPSQQLTASTVALSQVLPSLRPQEAYGLEVMIHLGKVAEPLFLVHCRF